MLRSIFFLAFGLVENCGQVHSFNRMKEWPAGRLLAFGVTFVLPSLNAFLRTWLYRGLHWAWTFMTTAAVNCVSLRMN